MALIVEDGSIVAGANSYLSVADFETYWTNRNVDLSTFTTAEKEAALIIATQFIDYNNFKGYTVEELQPLQWPRSYVVNRNGYSIESDTIPQAIKDATAEYAYRQLSAPLQGDTVEGGVIKRQMDKVGSLETETEYQDGGYFLNNRYPMADRLLIGLLQNDFATYARC